VARRAPLTLAALLLAACAGPPRAADPVEILVPVEVRAAPPPELTAPIPGPALADAFVAPGDARAAVALTAEGRDALVRLVDALARRLAAWRAWAGTTGPPED
jgi:hypothetical protein